MSELTDAHTQSTSVLTADDHTACAACNSPVAPDQRYCLNCGTRQGEPRVDFVELLSENREGAGPDAGRTGEPEQAPRDWTPVLALGGLAALALVLVVGVLIGRGGGNTAKQAAAPQIISVGPGGAGSSAGTSATNASTSKISEDWPAGKDAWTVQLHTLPKAGATAASVSAAKSAASGKGAPKVGVLDAANYKNLGSGYIIYSGVEKTRKDAETALGKLKKSFPGAKVIHVVPGGGAGAGASGGVGSPVSAQQQQQGAATIQKFQQACSGGNTAQCSKATKTTNPIATPGTPPPADNKPAGGGSAAQTIN